MFGFKYVLKSSDKSSLLCSPGTLRALGPVVGHQVCGRGSKERIKKPTSSDFFFENGSRFNFSMSMQRYLLQISVVMNPDLDFQDGGCIESFLWLFFVKFHFFSSS